MSAFVYMDDLQKKRLEFQKKLWMRRHQDAIESKKAHYSKLAPPS